MKYKISIRPINNDDMSKECPFPDTNPDSYDMYLRAFIEKIEHTEDITLTHSTSNNEIFISTDLEQDILVQNIKPIFSQFFCNLRFIDIEAITE